MIQSVPRTFADLAEGVPADASEHSDSVTHPGDEETVYRPTAEPAELLLTDSELLWSMKTPDGSVYGPVDRAELESWVKEGRVSSECLIRQQGQGHWQSALTLFPGLTAMHPKHRPRVATRAEPSSPGVERVHVAGLAQTRPHGGTGVLVLSIIGLMLPCFPIFSIVAVLWGWSERRGIARGTVSADSRMVLDIGFFLGIAGSVMGLIGFSSCFMI